MRRLLYKLFGWQKTCKHIWISTELFDKSKNPKCIICKHGFDELNVNNTTDREKHLKNIAKHNVPKSGQEKRRERRKRIRDAETKNK